MDMLIYAISFLLVAGFLRKTFSSQKDVDQIQKFKSECIGLATDTVSTGRKVLEASREVLDFK